MRCVRNVFETTQYITIRYIFMVQVSHPVWYIVVSLGFTVVATALITWEVKRMLKKAHV